MKSRNFTVDIDCLESHADVQKCECDFQNYLHDDKLFAPNHEIQVARNLERGFREKQGLVSDENAQQAILRLKRLQIYPCSVTALQQVWHRPFSGEHFISDIEALATHLNGKKMRIRSRPVISKDTLSDEVYLEYPEPAYLPAYLSQLRQLLEVPCSNFSSISIVMIWLFCLRAHFFDDGNGRFARAIGNIFLRNSTGVSSAKVFNGPQICVQNQKFTHCMTGFRRDDPHLVIAYINSISLT